jgi:hypothetical protein
VMTTYTQPPIAVSWRRRDLCWDGEEEREGCCIEGVTASDYNVIHKRAE